MRGEIRRGVIGLIAAATLGMLACGHVPTQPGARADLRRDAEQTIARMQAKDPSLKSVMDGAVGYIVFPRVGEAGFLIGGGAGNGVLFEGGQPSHFAELKQLQAGALAGGQKYSEIVVVRDQRALDDLKTGRYDFSAKASAIIVRTGAATNATFEKGVAVFVDPTSGAMVNASIGGQKIRLTL